MLHKKENFKFDINLFNFGDLVIRQRFFLYNFIVFYLDSYHTPETVKGREYGHWHIIR